MMRTTRVRRIVALLAVTAAVVGFGAASGGSAQEAEGARWVTAWATSQQALGATTITNATVRMIARVTAGGESVRVRLDNTFGTDPLVIGAAFVGPVMRAAALASGSNRLLRFGGSSSVAVAPGGTVQSDPVPMSVIARQDLAVSLYIPEADVRPSQHAQANVTSYLSDSGSGNVAADESAEAFTGTTTSTLWLKAIDVRSRSATGTVVGFGDSITDGTCTTLDAHDRWEDWLATRLYFAAPDAYPRGRERGYRRQYDHRRGATAAANQPAGTRSARARRPVARRRHARRPVHGNERRPPGGLGGSAHRGHAGHRRQGQGKGADHHRHHDHSAPQPAGERLEFGMDPGEDPDPPGGQRLDPHRGGV